MFARTYRATTVREWLAVTPDRTPASVNGTVTVNWLPYAADAMLRAFHAMRSACARETSVVTGVPSRQPSASLPLGATVGNEQGGNRRE